MRFLIDTQLPVALARFPSANGHLSEHVLDLGMGQAEDAVIREHALNTKAAVVSKDEDFVTMHLQDGAGPQIVWLRCGNIKNAVLIEKIAAKFPSIVAALERGEMIVEFA